tara:strand:+ start:1204 stop:1857 length:654 start_codon:yes stop_codon:yes gene_type:complete
MSFTTFVINMDTATDRWEYFKDKGVTRWSATDYRDIKVFSPDISRMISYHNISMKEHLCKIGCLKSHLNLWRYIAMNKMNNILVLEDDAQLVNPVPDINNFPQDGITYLGGFTSNVKMTEGPKKIEFENGIHKVDFNNYRVLMTVSYFIPTWEVAKKLVENVDNAERWRAVDCMLHKFKEVSFYLSYPGSFKEKAIPSQTRKNQKKFSNEFYELVKG